MFWRMVVTASPALILAIPLLFAFVITLMGRLFEKSVQGLFLSSLIITSFFVGVMAFEVLTVEGWSYVFGGEQPRPQQVSSFFRIIFVADGFSVLATITIAIIASVTGIYSYAYLKGESHLNKYYTLFLLTWAGINGMVLTNDLFNMFVWFEVTTIASSGLVAFQNYNRKSIEAALRYLVLSVAGGLFFLFSIALLYGQYGVLNLELLSEQINGSFNDKLAVGLIMIVFAMKSSSAPFHHWTPEVHGESPGPVSPFIAIMVMGYLLALFRLSIGVFSAGLSVEILGSILMILGILSMVVGIIMGFYNDDIKLIVVYLSISQIGYILLAMGVGLTTLNTGRYEEFGSLAFTGGLFHVINDAVYKTLLFLSVITVGHAAGTRDLNELSGIFYKMPYTSIFFLIGALSISGFPPFSGFYSKFLIYRSTYSFHPLLGLFTIVMTALIFLMMAKLFSSVFLGLTESTSEKEIPLMMFLSMIILSIIVIIFSIIPHIVISEIISPAVEALAMVF
ncbi:MAG: proton-conducting transporter membrane subunit [Candidatus Natronoplasma sp.]